MLTSPSAVPPAQRRFASPEQEVFLNLWRTYDRLRMLEDAVFAEFELTAQQYNVLRILKAAAPDALPTLELANRLISHAPDITRIVDRLETRGFVERRRQEHNRRVVQISITAGGRQILKTLATPLRECHERQLGHLSQAELRQLGQLLQAARQPHEASDSPWGQPPSNL